MDTQSTLDVVLASMEAWIHQDFATADGYLAEDVVYDGLTQHSTGARPVMECLTAFATQIVPGWQRIATFGDDHEALLMDALSIRFMAEYAAEESHLGGLGIQVTALLPRLGPTTGVGGPAIAAGARRAGVSEEAYLKQFGVSSTPQLVGEAVLQVLTDPALGSHRALLLTASGLAPVDGPLAPRVG